MPLDLVSVFLAFTLESSLDNFRRASPDEELISGALEITLCFPCMVLRFYMMAANLSFMPPNILIFMDTGAAVLACYVLLLDINWSFRWLTMFPVMGIVFIYALSRLYSKPYTRGEDREEAGIIPCSKIKEGEDREEAAVISCSQIKEGEDREEDALTFYSQIKQDGDDGHCKANQGSKGENLSTRNTEESSNEKITRVIFLQLEFIGIITFGALWAMDELLLDEHATDRFTISQFLLFLSFILAALTSMMKRLPTDVSPGIAPASELLHKTLLVLLLVTAHTVAAEALGEEVILLCMPEVIPVVLIWFSIHHGSVSDQVIETYKRWEWRISLGAVVALFLAKIDESVRPGWCTTIFVCCAISGLLANYVVFMLSHWPGQEPADDKQEPGKLLVQPADDKQDPGKLDVQAADGKQDPGKLAVELLKHWANDLLIAAAALLLVRYLLVHGLGWKEALTALSQTFERLISAVRGHTNTFWSIMPLLCSALFNLLSSSMNLHKDSPGIATVQWSFGICYNVLIVLHMFFFTGDVSHTLYYKYNSIALLWKGMQRILVI
ncbi:uncharacterized protein [Aegilops tauschii subsp. strangulata]|nr:uncharacterized protein LOC109737674 isoform X2 [Aegilops tauschii subsp. strangulata]